MKYQVAIIGGGPAGYTAAEAAGKAGLSVVLFEKQSLGGVCLNEGCIPTKTLLYSAKRMMLRVMLPNMQSLFPKPHLIYRRLLPVNRKWCVNWCWVLKVS